MYEASKDNIRCERWMLTGAVSNKRCQRGPAKEVAGACTQQLWVNIYCKWGWFVKWKKGCPWPAQDTWFSPIHLKILLWFWVWIRLTRFMMLLFMSAAVAWHETAHKTFSFAEQAPVPRMSSMTHWILFWNCNYNSIPLVAGKRLFHLRVHRQTGFVSGKTLCTALITLATLNNFRNLVIRWLIRVVHLLEFFFKNLIATNTHLNKDVFDIWSCFNNSKKKAFFL